jgi:hypothetical protein
MGNAELGAASRKWELADFCGAARVVLAEAILRFGLISCLNEHPR